MLPSSELPLTGAAQLSQRARPTAGFRVAIWLAVCAVPARAGAESAAAEVDAELDITADPTELDPGDTSTILVRLGNAGSFGIDSAVVAVQLPPELALVSSRPSSGTYEPSAGEWTTDEVLSIGSAELVLIVRAEGGGGAATVVAEVMSVEASFDATDTDSIPGNGEPCEDDYATATLVIAGDAGAGEPDPIDAGTDCGSEPDGGQTPDNDDDGSPGAPNPDAGVGDEGSDTGCGCSDAPGRPAPGLVLVVLAAAFAARSWPGRRTRRRPRARPGASA
jgi:Domain of unknown function DUF11